MGVMRPYVIWSPDYRHWHGGIRVLYTLGHMLRERGHQAEMRMTHRPFVPNPWNVPECVQIPDNAIHVYPEIVEGNPANSECVVWWLLNHADREGCRFVWHPAIGPEPVLNVPYIEQDIFYWGDQPRKGVVVWGGKGHVQFVPDGATLVTKTFPASRPELADLLRASEYMISFDAYTALNVEATLCGCPVVVLDRGQWNLAKAADGPMKMPGMVDSLDKLDEAKATVHGSTDAYWGYVKQMDAQVDNFINITQTLWSE